MGFYDSVKDRVREEETEDDPGDDPGHEDETMPFDQLKKRAEDKDENTEQEAAGDDTDIEVLASGERVEPDTEPDATEEDAEPQPEQDRTAAGQTSTAQSAPSDREPAPQEQTTTSGKAEETATKTIQEQPTAAQEDGRSDGSRDDELVSVLRSIEEQNRDILTVLRGIKRSLDGGDHGA